MTQQLDLRCPTCGSPDAELRYRLSRFEVLCCRACSLVYIWPRPSEDEIRAMFGALYTTGESSLRELRDYYGFCFDDAPSNPLVQTYELWLDALEAAHEPGRLLDVGCGTGLFLAVARRRGWKPFGIDDCAEATRHAREHFGLEIWDGEFGDFASGERRFDAITGWDILEHSRAPVELLQAMRRCLAPGGVVGLSTPNQRSILDAVAGSFYRLTGGRLRAPLEKFYIDQHFAYFTEETLSHALGRAGLALVECQRELTDLRRLSLSAPMRLVLRALFQAARFTGLENRLFALARATDAPIGSTRTPSG
jgi:SAM-dependent methyltransferase